MLVKCQFFILLIIVKYRFCFTSTTFTFGYLSKALFRDTTNVLIFLQNIFFYLSFVK